MFVITIIIVFKFLFFVMSYAVQYSKFFRFIFDQIHPPPLLLLLDLHGLWKSLIMEADRRYVSHNSRQDKNNNKESKIVCMMGALQCWCKG